MEYLQTIHIDNKEVSIYYNPYTEEDKYIPIYESEGEDHVESGMIFTPYKMEFNYINLNHVKKEPSVKILKDIIIGKKVVDDGVLSIIYNEIGPIILKERNERLENIKKYGSMFDDPRFSKFR